MSSLTYPASQLLGIEHPNITRSDICKAIFREAMKKLPEEEKVKIQAQVEEFRTEQMKFDREVIHDGKSSTFTYILFLSR